jgi:hypothetical protein
MNKKDFILCFLSLLLWIVSQAQIYNGLNKGIVWGTDKADIGIEFVGNPGVFYTIPELRLK